MLHDFDLSVQASAHREVLDLCGLWDLRLDAGDAGERDAWQGGLPGPVRKAAVPASYNDLYADAATRDHVGPVWYERRFFVPSTWDGRRLFLRFASVTHHARAWLDGQEITAHRGGYLPFGAEVTGAAIPGREVRLNVQVDNRLDWTTLPPGIVEERTLSDGTPHRTQRYFHDFFNYAGIDRPVVLFSTGPAVIASATAEPVLCDGNWQVRFAASIDGPHGAVRAVLRDAGGREVGALESASGSIPVPDPQLWQPGAAYLYRLDISVSDTAGTPSDSVSVRVGLREVRVTSDAFLINGAPFYFRGFGKHEDFCVIGKGLNLPLLVRDFALLEWIGGNSVRTSHYPYSEEFLDMADERGLVVISEAPAVGQTLSFGPGGEQVFVEGKVDARAQAHHLDVMRRLVARDRNHPSVVMWCVGNEPNSQDPGAEAYFAPIVALTKSLDPARPVMIVEHQPPSCNRTAHLSDVIGLNRYFGWYSEPGDLVVAADRLRAELAEWRTRFGKPVFMTEYGADTIAGLHALPEVMFSEEFQTTFLDLYHRIFDETPFLIGEHVWNFADFATKQGITRIGGNKKGVFSRDRQPKAAAHLLRQRWQNPPQKG